MLHLYFQFNRKGFFCFSLPTAIGSERKFKDKDLKKIILELLRLFAIARVAAKKKIVEKQNRFIYLKSG